ncbi:MAG: type II secretion system F family protein [Bacillota bacterium]
MPLYSFQALDRTGNQLGGKLEAEDETAAIARLRKMDYTILDISPVKKSLLNMQIKLGPTIKISDVSFFTRQLAAMLAAGIPLTRSLTTLGEQGGNPAMAKVINSVARNVEGGMNFSEALSGFPEVFPQIYVDLVKAGEMGGALEEMLNRISHQLDRDKALRDNIKSALMYPVVILSFAFIVVLAILIFMVPTFMSFYPPGSKLPFVTQMVGMASSSIRVYWYLYILGAVSAVTALYFASRSETVKLTWDRVKFRIPLFGNLLHKTTIARFSRTLSTLLLGAIPVIQALEAAGPSSGSIRVSEAVKEAGKVIQEGQTLAFPLKKTEIFPPMVINMISIGEETGELPTLLSRVADFYEEEVSTMTKGLTALIEPLMIIVVGIVVGGIIISVYLPMFNIITTTGVR